MGELPQRERCFDAEETRLSIFMLISVERGTKHVRCRMTLQCAGSGRGAPFVERKARRARQREKEPRSRASLSLYNAPLWPHLLAARACVYYVPLHIIKMTMIVIFVWSYSRGRSGLGASVCVCP